MSPIRIVSPEEAMALLEGGGSYLDVRSEPEFVAGHPPSAFNVPFFEGTDYRADFVAIVRGNFSISAPLVVGCRSGALSRRASELLAAAGYVNLVDMTLGWEGNRDAFGRLRPGWRQRGLPHETGLPATRTLSYLEQHKAPDEPSELDTVAK